MTRRGLILLVVVLSVGSAGAVTFVRAPTVKETARGLRIEFILDGITDVTVAVLDAKGRVVRHLAAGVLGEHAPPPLITNAYGQSLTWDRKNDAGALVPPGRYTVRVTLGLKPTFSRLIGADPTDLGRVLGLAVQPKTGDLFVLGAIGESDERTAVIQVRDRSGTYVRTVLPYSAALRSSQVGGLRLAGGRWAPRVYDGFAHALMPGLGVPLRQTMAMTSSGRLLFDSGLSGQRRVLWLSPDGTWPIGGVGGPLLPRAGGAGHLHLALSANEAYLYASGLRRATGPPEPLHVVYRTSPRAGGPAEVFLGELGRPGSDERHFNDPRGVATDPVGNVYVADHGNDRIGVFTPGGKWLGAVPCPQPDQVFVHPKTGHIYVLALDQTERQMLTRWNEPVVFRKKRLLKLAGWQPQRGVRPGTAAGRVLASLDLPRREGYPVLALDATADPPVLWCSEGLWRIEDRGDTFRANRGVLVTDRRALTACGALCVDPTRDEVYVDTLAASGHRWVRYDGRTGRHEAFGLRGREATHLTVGPTGLIYLRSPGRVSRFDRDGRPAPFETGGSYRLALPGGDQSADRRGLTVAPNGDIYLLRRSGSKGASPLQIDVLTPDGAVRQAGLVTGLTPGAASIRVDASGNVYVADCLTPGHEVVPRALAGQVPPVPGKPNWYALLHGSVIKFGPKGGTVKPAGVGQYGYAVVTPAGTRTVSVTGAEWIKAGCAPVLAHGTAGGTDLSRQPFPKAAPPARGSESLRGVLAGGARRYWCASSFDVDGFGRSFVPNALTAQVVVLDPGGNEIARFGGYGNADAPGGTTPAVPLAWPAHVAVSGAACYVADPLNHRIVRLELRYAQTAQVAVTVK